MRLTLTGPTAGFQSHVLPEGVAARRQRHAAEQRECPDPHQFATTDAIAEPGSISQNAQHRVAPDSSIAVGNKPGQLENCAALA
jgi:hypothetical protein